MVYHALTGEGVKSCWCQTVRNRLCDSGSPPPATVTVMTDPPPVSRTFLGGHWSCSSCRRTRPDCLSSPTVTLRTPYRVPLNTAGRNISDRAVRGSGLCGRASSPAAPPSSPPNLGPSSQNPQELTHTRRCTLPHRFRDTETAGPGFGFALSRRRLPTSPRLGHRRATQPRPAAQPQPRPKPRPRPRPLIAPAAVGRSAMTRHQRKVSPTPRRSANHSCPALPAHMPPSPPIRARTSTR